MTAGMGQPLEGESWEQYAHRLEERIKRQRDEIEKLYAERPPGAGNKWTRKKVVELERALGKWVARWEKEHEMKRALYKKLKERDA